MAILKNRSAELGGETSERIVTCGWCGNQVPERLVDRKDHDSWVWLCVGCLYCAKHGSPKLDE